MSEVKERPIIMSAPMVRAILAGTKTQTRRPLYVATTNCASAREDRRYPPDYGNSEHPNLPPGHAWTLSGWRKAKPGDRLWVRETHAPQADCWGSWERWSKGFGGPAPIIHYAADKAEKPFIAKWRPSIHMPRWASRITLEITGVRVERLQDISEEDAIADGIEADMLPCDPVPLWRNYATGGITISPVYSYQTLWESINGRDSWVVNPWVWVISFNRLERTYGGT